MPNTITPYLPDLSALGHLYKTPQMYRQVLEKISLSNNNKKLTVLGNGKLALSLLPIFGSKNCEEEVGKFLLYGEKNNWIELKDQSLVSSLARKVGLILDDKKSEQEHKQLTDIIRGVFFTINRRLAERAAPPPKPLSHHTVKIIPEKIVEPEPAFAQPTVVAEPAIAAEPEVIESPVLPTIPIQTEEPKNSWNLSLLQKVGIAAGLALAGIGLVYYYYNYSQNSIDTVEDLKSKCKDALDEVQKNLKEAPAKLTLCKKIIPSYSSMPELSLNFVEKVKDTRNYVCYPFEDQCAFPKINLNFNNSLTKTVSKSTEPFSIPVSDHFQAWIDASGLVATNNSDVCAANPYWQATDDVKTTIMLPTPQTLEPPVCYPTPQVCYPPVSKFDPVAVLKNWELGRLALEGFGVFVLSILFKWNNSLSKKVFELESQKILSDTEHLLENQELKLKYEEKSKKEGKEYADKFPDAVTSEIENLKLKVENESLLEILGHFDGVLTRLFSDIFLNELTEDSQEAKEKETETKKENILDRRVFTLQNKFHRFSEGLHDFISNRNFILIQLKEALEKLHDQKIQAEGSLIGKSLLINKELNKLRKVLGLPVKKGKGKLSDNVAEIIGEIKKLKSNLHNSKKTLEEMYEQIENTFRDLGEVEKRISSEEKETDAYKLLHTYFELLKLFCENIRVLKEISSYESSSKELANLSFAGTTQKKDKEKEQKPPEGVFIDAEREEMLRLVFEHVQAIGKAENEKESKIRELQEKLEFFEKNLVRADILLKAYRAVFSCKEREECDIETVEGKRQVLETFLKRIEEGCRKNFDREEDEAEYLIQVLGLLRRILPTQGD